MRKVFSKPASLSDKPFHYCPGCTHGIIHRLIAEVIDELNIKEEVIGIAPIGCAVFMYDYFDFDFLGGAHGRAPAVATGVKRVHPDKMVFTYQGDGDAAAIGTAEIVHAAARSEKITSLFINNAIYGMTGGQMAPTTLLGQESTTSPEGRSKEMAGYPIRLTEMLATLEGTVYAARVSVHDVKHIIQAKKVIKRAFEIQQKKVGFALVEVLSTCPTNWGLTPIEATKWLEQNMIPYYPLGEIKVPKEV
ncbi:MAG: thiamine pyrophosphate-dependent enzyme [Clostridia bacterium]|nr:thiamine pyrophosphate-dependent enzyme [Clostridia bacterium]